MSSIWKQNWAHVAAAALACVAFAAGAPQAGAVAAPALAADFDQDGDVDSGDLGVWDAAKFTSAFADADGDGQSDVTDLMIWDDQRGQIAVASTAEAPAVVGVPDVYYNPATGAVTLVPNMTAIYAFKLPLPGNPATSGLPASWSVRSEFNRLQGYDTTIVTNTPSNLPQFALGSIAGPVTLGLFPIGMTSEAFSAGFLYDTTTALNATAPVQIVPEPTSTAILLGGAALLFGMSRRRK